FRQTERSPAGPGTPIPNPAGLRSLTAIPPCAPPCRHNCTGAYDSQTSRNVVTDRLLGVSQLSGLGLLRKGIRARPADCDCAVADRGSTRRAGSTNGPAIVGRWVQTDSWPTKADPRRTVPCASGYHCSRYASAVSCCSSM